MDKLIKNNKKFAYFIGIFCMLLWGSAFPVLKISYSELNMSISDNMSRIFFAGIRFFNAGLLVLLYGLLFKKDEIKKSKINWKFLITIAITQTSLQYIFFYIGVANTTGTKSAILQASTTFFVVILSHFIFKDDKINFKKIAALILGFGGIIVANLGKGFDLNFSFKGEFFLLISTFLGAIGIILVRKYGQKMSSFVICSAQMIIGGLFLLIFGKSGMTEPLIFTTKAKFLLIYASFLSAVAFVLWYKLLQNYKVGEISVLKLFTPIFGAILSSIFLGEVFTINILLGLILVILGILVLYK